MGAALNVLLIEDSENDSLLMVRELTKAGYSVSFERVYSAANLSAALEKGGWDVVVSDFTMPGFSGTEALSQVRKHDSELPFLFMSGTIGEDTAVAAMRSGADDYIMKGNLRRFVPAVERALRDVSVRRARRRAEDRVLHLAYHDVLTDLPNRSLLHDRLEQAISSARRTRDPVALLVMDLNGFKAINDSLGHSAGDEVLRQVAGRLLRVLREADTVARLGGDEFALVLPFTNGEGATIVARKFLEALRQPILIEGRSLAVAASVGIAWFPEHGATSEMLLQKADIAMYAAKSVKLESAIYTAERDHQAHSRLMVVAELQEGIERDEFVFEYQPLVSLANGAVVGVEALARWQHPRQGLLPPELFINLAEQTGLIEPLTMLLLDKALGDSSALFSHLAIPVSVNLSARNLQDPELPDRISDLLRARGISSSMLHLEITENFVMSDPTRAAKCLTRLHDKGTALAIDDFGTGYSSLSYLRQLPVDVLKIDHSFIVGLTRADDAIVRCAIDLGHNLGLSVVAEGVESAVVCDHLRELGCDTVQGFFLAPPRPARETLSWIEQRPPSRTHTHQWSLPLS